MGPLAPAGLPLEGLLVVDLTVARAGPTCVRHLADWGADVVRVVAPATGEDSLLHRDGADYQNLHRNKRLVALDLKSDAGRADFLRLIQSADVFVENMRVAVKHRLKIAWEDLAPLNPRLIYGSISGFGQTGPYRERAGVDQVAQGMGGMMSVTGEPGGPPMRAGIAVADMTAGNLLALAIMMALHERTRTGRGRWVHTSLLESQIFMMDFQAARYLMDGEVPVQTGNGHPTLVPTGAYRTRDGYVNIAPSSPRQWQTFCEIFEQPEWLTHPEFARYAARLQNRAAIDAAIDERTREQTTAYWVERLERAGIPCGPIYDMRQVFDDPQVAHLQMATPVEHPTRGTTRLVASAIHLEGAAPRAPTAALSEPLPAGELWDWLASRASKTQA